MKGLSVLKWYLQAFKKFGDFSGRARRKEYWYFVLFHIFIQLAILFIFGGPDVLNQNSNATLGTMGVIVLILYIIITFIPALGLQVRRYHDTNRSGFYIFMSLIPCVGAMLQVIALCTEGDRFANKYGPDPKEAEYGNREIKF
jgi:uncharacterized membrane protein YhaH (DUF805 family)